MSGTMRPGDHGPGGGTTDADRLVAARFVLGRPGWRVEALATAQGEAYLRLTTPRAGTGGQRTWRVARTGQGLLVHDEETGQQPLVAPTMREALVEVWEVVTGAAPD